MRRLAVLVCIVWGLLLSACEAPSAARATLREARAVVEVVYQQLPDAFVDRLPFTAGQISPAVKRMRSRFPSLRPWLEDGRIGVGASGLVVVRTLENVSAEQQTSLRALVREENRDRLALYSAHTEDVGHGNDMFGDVWSGFEGAAFAAEWIDQAPAGWWYQDDSRRWLQKKTEPRRIG